MDFIQNLFSKSIKFDLNKDEVVIHQGDANLFRKNEVTGGLLYLTNERLIFVPHIFNIDRSRQDIEIEEILRLKEVRTLIIDNGLVIESKQQVDYRFVLNEREKWVEELEKLID